jgi:uncharacterized protein
MDKKEASMAGIPIVIAGAAPWAGAVHGALPDARIMLHDTLRDVRQLVIDHSAAALLLDATDRDWVPCAREVHGSAATRRVPIILIGTIPLADAQAGGADFVLTPEAIATELAALVEGEGRYLRAATRAALKQDCRAELPLSGHMGMVLFNAGEFYAQHDVFEALWVETQSPVRELYRAILQVGIAHYHIERGNHRGALRMLERASYWLAIMPECCQGLDVADLRAHTRQLRAWLASGAAGPLPPDLRPTLKWHSASR